jgi:hypothetical protein
MSIRITSLALAAAALLAGCEGGLAPYAESPGTVIATNRDSGRDQVSLREGFAAVAYDPDGCQNWIIDDGVEGYATKRYDPVSGLPVCNNRYPVGAVVGVYQTPDAGINDYVPGSSRGRQ